MKKRKLCTAMRLWRAYAISTVACLCVAAACCGYIIADENTQSIASGYSQDVAAGRVTATGIVVTHSDRSYDLTVPATVSELMKIMPTPVGNIVSIGNCIIEIITFYSSES